MRWKSKVPSGVTVMIPILEFGKDWIGYGNRFNADLKFRGKFMKFIGKFRTSIVSLSLSLSLWFSLCGEFRSDSMKLNSLSVNLSRLCSMRTICFASFFPLFFFRVYTSCVHSDLITCQMFVKGGMYSTVWTRQRVEEIKDSFCYRERRGDPNR